MYGHGWGPPAHPHGYGALPPPPGYGHLPHPVVYGYGYGPPMQQVHPALPPPLRALPGPPPPGHGPPPGMHGAPPGGLGPPPGKLDASPPATSTSTASRPATAPAATTTPATTADGRAAPPAPKRHLPPKLLGSLQVEGCSNPVVKKQIEGTFEDSGHANGRTLWKRTTKAGEDDVMIYYWDERDGAVLQGWWIGPTVGGEAAWAHNPNYSANLHRPPEKGWKVLQGGSQVCQSMKTYYKPPAEGMKTPLQKGPGSQKKASGKDVVAGAAEAVQKKAEATRAAMAAATAVTQAAAKKEQGASQAAGAALFAPPAQAATSMKQAMSSSLQASAAALQANVQKVAQGAPQATAPASSSTAAAPAGAAATGSLSWLQPAAPNAASPGVGMLLEFKKRLEEADQVFAAMKVAAQALGRCQDTLSRAPTTPAQAQELQDARAKSAGDAKRLTQELEKGAEQTEAARRRCSNFVLSCRMNLDKDCQKSLLELIARLTTFGKNVDILWKHSKAVKEKVIKLSVTVQKELNNGTPDKGGSSQSKSPENAAKPQETPAAAARTSTSTLAAQKPALAQAGFFEKYDEDGDGFLSAADVQRFASQEYDFQLTPEKTKQIMDELAQSRPLPPAKRQQTEAGGGSKPAAPEETARTGAAGGSSGGTAASAAGGEAAQGIGATNFARLRTMVGIAREEMKARQRRLEKEAAANLIAEARSKRQSEEAAAKEIATAAAERAAKATATQDADKVAQEKPSEVGERPAEKSACASREQPADATRSAAGNATTTTAGSIGAQNTCTTEGAVTNPPDLSKTAATDAAGTAQTPPAAAEKPCE
eukprot:TRINITY_DN50876_c0_g1_i1.p1 TRINITY_DN50876_c0_g1~~TRINITY_DN50876_c0_g1_i1.p1  ORF type:complete len:823 (+),score=256.61 TRINITY_DN50876_c0_g1_i1:104-2572(+)